VSSDNPPKKSLDLFVGLDSFQIKNTGKGSEGGKILAGSQRLLLLQESLCDLSSEISDLFPKLEILCLTLTKFDSEFQQFLSGLIPSQVSSPPLCPEPCDKRDRQPGGVPWHSARQSTSLVVKEGGAIEMKKRPSSSTLWIRSTSDNFKQKKISSEEEFSLLKYPSRSIPEVERAGSTSITRHLLSSDPRVDGQAGSSAPARSPALESQAQAEGGETSEQ